MSQGALSFDEKGRVVLPKDIRQALGKKFYAIKAHGEVILVPIPNDPIKAFAEMGKKAGFDKLSIREIKEEARKYAIEQYDLR